ncbi:FAD-dependent oxidoreductase [Lactovum odontotermitis]
MKIIIIGGSHAGIACALRAREEYPDSSIVIYEKQRSIGFGAQSIPLFLAGNNAFLKVSNYMTASDLEKLNIMVKTKTTVSEADLKKKVIYYKDLLDESDQEIEDHYDKLILATGSYPSMPLIKGGFLDKLYIVKQAEDAVKLKQFMKHSRSIIIIGGGSIAVEMARIMNEAQIKTTLIHSSDYILNRYLDREIGEEVQQFLEDKGIRILTNSTVTDITEEVIDENLRKKVSHVFTQDGREFTADGVIYSTGFRPNSVLVADQVTLGERGAILVDEYMRTSFPDVFAVGDCATTMLSNVKAPAYITHASDALREGDAAAVNLVEPKIKLNKSQGTYKINLDDEYIVSLAGLTFNKAKSEGFDCSQVFIRNDDANNDKYYEIWLVYENETHKILGLQSKGTADEVASLADVISLAIQEELTVQDIEYADFYFKHGFKNPSSFSKLLADKIRYKEKAEYLNERH